MLSLLSREEPAPSKGFSDCAARQHFLYRQSALCYKQRLACLLIVNLRDQRAVFAGGEVQLQAFPELDSIKLSPKLLQRGVAISLHVASGPEKTGLSGSSYILPPC